MIAAAVASSRAASRAAHGRGGLPGHLPASGRLPVRYSARESDSEPSWSVLLLMTVVSAGLLCAAIWYLISALMGTREQKGSAYGDAVSRWARARHDFEGLRVMASTRYESIALHAESTVDKLHDAEDAFDLPVYDPLTYRVRGVPPSFFPAASFDHLQRHEATLAETLRGPHQARQPHRPTQDWGTAVSLALTLEDGFGKPVNLELGTYPLVRAIVKHAPTPGPEFKCRRELAGLYKGGSCLVFSQLSGICVQVAPDRDGWKLATRDLQRNESFGCDYSHGQWVAARYQQVPAMLAKGFVRFDNLSIEVRSVDDPYFSALELTEGSLDFGMTSNDDRSVGFVLLCLGLVIACPPSLAAYKHWKGDAESARSIGYFSRPNDHGHRNDDFEEGIALGSYAGFESEMEMH